MVTDQVNEVKPTALALRAARGIIGYIGEPDADVVAFICSRQNEAAKIIDAYLVPLLEEIREGLQAIRMLDKTRYDHHQPRPDGAKPMDHGGTCWLTPKEKATQIMQVINNILKESGVDGPKDVC